MVPVRCQSLIQALSHSGFQRAPVLEVTILILVELRVAYSTIHPKYARSMIVCFSRSRGFHRK
jgi:hypothetical protein